MIFLNVLFCLNKFVSILHQIYYMKIPVYSINQVTPKNENECQFFCDIFNVPSLKNGSVEFLGECISHITKKEYNKAKKINARFYNIESKSFVEGVIIFLDNSQKTFVAY